MSSPAEIDFFCPSCAAPATGGTTFCKGCGADVRYVPRAMRGGLTKRQRTFVNTILSIPGFFMLSGLMGSMMEINPLYLFALVAAALGLVGTAGYAGYLLVRDGSSPDPIFRLSQRAAPPVGAVGGTTEDETPTRRF